MQNERDFHFILRILVSFLNLLDRGHSFMTAAKQLKIRTTPIHSHSILVWFSPLGLLWKLFFGIFVESLIEIGILTWSFFLCQFTFINPLSAYPTKWSNTLKRFVGCCRGLKDCLKGCMCTTLSSMIKLESERLESNQFFDFYERLIYLQCFCYRTKN